jgi:excisionase family DNA binding protein
MFSKITAKHLSRSAYVYVRQSTSYQVQYHVESKQRQYELSNAAINHGWRSDQVVVIDDDLGKSASSAEGRVGFQRLVSEVALGRAGIVLGLEVSRLARNNRDWYHLLDLCAVRETLIADTDGVYDPAAHNDRLLLGLKGTMSEAELHVLKSRMAAGLRHKAQKGALRFRLVPGYEFDGERIIKTSDEKVSHFMTTLFAKVFEIGSVSGVTKFFVHAGLSFPRRVAADGSIRWVTPYYRGIYTMLTNPIYAGVYAYGRSESVVDMDADARMTTRRRAKPMAQWDVLLHDHHPAYISWDEFVRLGKILEKNRPAPRDEASQALREGSALLQGLARCGECGRSMKMRYHGPATGNRYASYICDGSQQQMRASQCRSVGARRIDDAIARLFLAAVSGASVEIQLAALRKLDDREDAVLRQIDLQLESARYEARRAERQYDAVEPENRVVARTLESRWNAALERVHELEHQLDDRKRQIAKRLTEDEERRLKELAHDLPKLWSHDLVTDRDRKALLRAAIDEVQIRKQTPQQVHLKVIWKGGAVDELSIEMPRVPPSPSTPAELVELVRALAAKYDDAQIARILVRRRIKTPRKKIAFTANHVGDLRRQYGIPRCSARTADEGATTYTVEQAAKLLGVSGPTIYLWLKLGVLHGEQLTEGAPWSIEITEAERARFVASAPEGWLSLKEAAAELGVSKQTILNWVKARKVEFVYVKNGRRRALRIDGKTAPYRAQQNLVD